MTMVSNRKGHSGGRLRAVVGLAILAGFSALALPSLAKIETWRDEGTSGFSKGRREGLVVTDEGRLVLGRVLTPEGTLSASRVWDLAATADDKVFAATGDQGKVYQRDLTAKTDWTVALDAGDTQALALAVGPLGEVVVGTGPSGKVIELSKEGHPSSRPHPDVLYIWDLAFDSQGTLFAATGPKGQLWKRPAGGEWTLAFDAKATHLLCLAIGSDNAIYTAGDLDGVIYRIGRDGKVSVVYDASQDEVRALLVLPDGTLFAGTAMESSGGSSRSTTSRAEQASSDLTERTADDGLVRTALTAPAQVPSEKKSSDDPKPKGAASPGGGTATPKSPTPGENSVYRIDPDGVAREVFREKTLVHALAYQNGRLLIATGPDGVLHELTQNERKSSPIAKLDSGHLVSLLGLKGGDLLVGTADPSRVVRLEAAHVRTGTLISEVRDTKLTSRFGALDWTAEVLEGTSVDVQVRSGNLAEPDETWSPWSDPHVGFVPFVPAVPAGRFAQYRVTLATNDPLRTPSLKSVSLRYKTSNLPPEINKLEVPDLAGLDGGTKPSKLTFRWEASDPNGDDLQYVLDVRKEGWPGWVRLTDQPLTEKTYAVEVGTLPDGHYQLRLSADDRLANNPAESLEASRTSDTFLVDGLAPVVSLVAHGRKVSATLKDASTRIARASYSVDGKPWVPVFADDGLFDTPTETLSLSITELAPGPHVVVIRANDAAGNLGTADILVNLP